MLLILFVLRMDVAFIQLIARDPISLWSLVYLMIVLTSTYSLYPFLKIMVSSFSLLVTIEKGEKETYPRYLKAITKSNLYFAYSLSLALPFVYLFVDKDDSPGFLLIYLVLVSFGYFFAALGKVLKDMVNTG
jgi:hypothetical protein